MVGHSGRQAQNGSQMVEAALDIKSGSALNFRSSNITREQSIAYHEATKQALSMYKMPIVPPVQWYNLLSLCLCRFD